MTGKELLSKAEEARKNAYVPYSGFAVGAAALSKDGRGFTGCNIENAAYGVTNCAERTAIFKAISEGVREFAALAVVADTAGPVSPCGACRQVMAEFFEPDMPIYLGSMQGAGIQTEIKSLLPGAFTSKELKHKDDY